MNAPDSYADKWCRDCQQYRARHQDGYTCPCCQDIAAKAKQAARIERGWAA